MTASAKHAKHSIFKRKTLMLIQNDIEYFITKAKAAFLQGRDDLGVLEVLCSVGVPNHSANLILSAGRLLAADHVNARIKG
jgi:hypothetical protein